MKSVILLGLMALPLPNVASAQSPGFTEHILYQTCSSEDDGMKAICVAYLRGFLYGVRFGEAMQKRGHPICLAKSMDPMTARLIVKKFIEDNPKTLDADGPSGGEITTLMALAAAYPCPAEANSN